MEKSIVERINEKAPMEFMLEYSDYEPQELGDLSEKEFFKLLESTVNQTSQSELVSFVNDYLN